MSREKQLIFEHVYFEMSMRHISRDVKWTVGYEHVYVWSSEELGKGMNMGVSGMYLVYKTMEMVKIMQRETVDKEQEP